MARSSNSNQKLNAQTIAVLALIESGVRDHIVIAEALGLSEEQVVQIDTSDDQTLRRFAVVGIPPEFTYRLRHVIRCPRCRQRITVAPCLTCRSNKVRSNKAINSSAQSMAGRVNSPRGGTLPDRPTLRSGLRPRPIHLVEFP